MWIGGAQLSMVYVACKVCSEGLVLCPSHLCHCAVTNGGIFLHGCFLEEGCGHLHVERTHNQKAKTKGAPVHPSHGCWRKRRRGDSMVWVHLDQALFVVVVSRKEARLC